MITIRLKDKRHVTGCKIVFFPKDNVITPEIYAFVKRHKNAYWISGYGFTFYEREDFLEHFSCFEKKKKDPVGNPKNSQRPNSEV